MTSPLLPVAEDSRLAALHNYAVLDTPAEPEFDDLTRIAAHILDVPTALISLVDADRQWFKSRYGLEAPELPRDISFCGHVVESGARMIIPDSLEDVRFSNNPLVTGQPRIRFYAGVPLRTPDGFVLGTLCAIDYVPRTPSSAQLAMLELLAKQVVDQLEASRARREMSVHRDEAVADAARSAAVFSVMADGVVVQDAHGQIVSSNSAAESILGLSHEQLNGRTSIDPRWRSVREDGTPFPGEDHPAMVALRTGQVQRNVVMGVHKPDGSLTWININALPLERNGDTVSEVVTTFHDFTGLKNAAARLAIQERLATTGTLVAGVGHEINNPLAFVLGNLDLALEELRSLAGPSPSVRLRELLDVIGEARLGADRIRKIVRGLRALSREDVALQPVDVEPVVETSLSMALHELRPKAAVELEFAELPMILGDESRLTQVLVNLLVNAAQALPAATRATNRIIVRGARFGSDSVRISVIDNGPGIPPELVSRIFDPFFTTKPIGEGTGLGLAVSRGIVHALGGQLTVESQPGLGAQFHLDLPIAHEETLASDTSVVAAAGSSGTVLVIDDDLSVLSTMRRVLTRDYVVTAISEPRQALDMLCNGADFDVIFCDLMMPHVSGQEVFDAVRAARPDLAARFIFVTGGATTTAARVFLGELSNDVLEKPFRLEDLLAIARRNLVRRQNR
jgi:PAS domain S-box-containing protein